MARRAELTGKVFGRLTVVGFAYVKHNRTHWHCACDCGGALILPNSALQSGNTSSCGCLHRELMSKRFGTHGLCATPEYEVWLALRDRCNNPNNKEYPNYGARGIKCHPDFDDFPTFLAHVGKRPSKGLMIDRIDNELGYAPGNVRWATPTQQANNKRNNVRLTFRGKTQTATEWCRELNNGMKARVVHIRLRLGWSDEDAITIPIKTVMPRTIAFKGTTMTISQWAIETGISESVIRDRIRRGLSDEEVLTIPLGAHAFFRGTKTRRRSLE